MNYTHPFERPGPRKVTPEYDSDLDSALRMYEKETRNEKMFTYPTSGCRNSRGESIWSPYEDSLYRREHRDTDIDDELASLLRQTTMNLFGRTFKETLADFPKVVRPRGPRRDNCATPSLTSDDTSSPSASSFVASPSPVTTNDTSLPSSPKQSGPARYTPQIQSASEDVAARPIYDLPPIRREESVIESNSYGLRTASDENEPPLSGYTPFKQNVIVDVHKPIEISTKVHNTTASVTNIIEDIDDDDDEEVDQLIDDKEYIPDPQDVSSILPPKRGRKRGPKSNGPFKCTQCSKVFTRNFDKNRHMNTVHGKPSEGDITSRCCSCCGVVLSRNDAFIRHMSRVPATCIRYAIMRKIPLTQGQKEEIAAMQDAGKPPRFPPERFGVGPGGLYSQEQC